MSDIHPIENSVPETAESPKVPEAAIGDVARYQEQLLRMILHHDDRALRVLSLYLTVLGALVTASLALRQAQMLTAYIVILIACAAVSLLIGCGLAYRAAWTARIYLPGRKSDFWIWAMENQLSIGEAALAYAKQAEDMIAHNEKIADRAASNLAKAHLCGILAPFVGSLASAFAYAARTYIT
jgi:hypothetical protein